MATESRFDPKPRTTAPAVAPVVEDRPAPGTAVAVPQTAEQKADADKADADKAKADAKAARAAEIKQAREDFDSYESKFTAVYDSADLVGLPIAIFRADKADRFTPALSLVVGTADRLSSGPIDISVTAKDIQEPTDADDDTGKQSGKNPFGEPTRHLAHPMSGNRPVA